VSKNHTGGAANSALSSATPWVPFTGWHADLHGISPEAGLQRLLQTGCHLENWD
jgi:hypothetical protein